MSEWGFNPETVSAISSLTAAVAVIIAMIGLVIGYVQNRRARNLQAFLEISNDMRRRWEKDWDVTLSSCNELTS